ncbi:YoaK family protein [Paraburkholderia sp. J41]|uniref:YoaK family protein n=1 Tax=Paraburkholderia sp. J41 TaxID=2805433 RepID=UPI002AC34E28|nr:YoaK family protein [Paraburkholderia sp. J41]
MPIQYLRSFTSVDRTDKANLRLGRALAAIAGATNAGGFLAVGQYTSHMSGIVSSVADNVALGDLGLALAALSSILAFGGGAATSAIMINWGRRRAVNSVYALPMLLEAALLLGFALLGANMEHHRVLFVPATVALLCFVMGLQNAMITKISRAEIRTTHMTGIVTDLGIELGKGLYWNWGVPAAASQHVKADAQRVRVLASLLGMFLLGGTVGAVAFRHFGFVSGVLLSAMLLALACVPVADDLRRLPPRGLT